MGAKRTDHRGPNEFQNHGPEAQKPKRKKEATEEPKFQCTSGPGERRVQDAGPPRFVEQLAAIAKGEKEMKE